jgi:transcriptional regulator
MPPDSAEVHRKDMAPGVNHDAVSAIGTGIVRLRTLAAIRAAPSAQRSDGANRSRGGARPDETDLLLSQRTYGILPVGNPNRDAMKETDVRQGTLALMVLKTLDILGPLHGYGIARRIEQISGDLLTVNQGTLYPVLLKLEQEGSIASEWGASENNRKARFYKLTRQGRKQLQAEARSWEQTAAIIERFFAAKVQDLK